MLNRFTVQKTWKWMCFPMLSIQRAYVIVVQVGRYPSKVSITISTIVPMVLVSRPETWKTVRVIQFFDYTSIELLRPCNTWQELVKLVPEMSVYVTVKVMSKFQWKLQDAGDARTMRYPGKKSGDMKWSQSKKVYISQSKQRPSTFFGAPKILSRASNSGY